MFIHIAIFLFCFVFCLIVSIVAGVWISQISCFMHEDQGWGRKEVDVGGHTHSNRTSGHYGSLAEMQERAAF